LMLYGCDSQPIYTTARSVGRSVGCANPTHSTVLK
jgi:hypothetical protein